MLQNRCRHEHELMKVEAWKRRIGFPRKPGADRLSADAGVGGFREDRLPVFLRADAPGERFGAQARAAAGRAGSVGAVARKHDANVHLVVLRFKPLEEAPDAVPLGLPFPRPPGLSLFNDPARFFGEVLIGDVRRNAESSAGAQHVVLAFRKGLGGERLYGVFPETFRAVGDDEGEVGPDDAAEAAADRTGADRRIEAEGSGLRGREGKSALRAGKPVLVARESSGGFARTFRPDGDAPVAPLQCRLNRLNRAASLHGRRAEAVGGNDEQRAVASRLARQNAREALGGEARFRRFEGKRLRDEALKGDGRSGVRFPARREAPEDVLPHGVGGKVEDGRAVIGAEGSRLSREEKLQTVVDLRHRAHGRARGADDGVLINGDRGRHALDRLNLRAVHAVEKLARIGAEGLHVPALTFRIQRIEDERAFPGPRKPRDDGEAPDGNVQIQVLEIILLGAADADRRRPFIPGVAGRILLGHLLEGNLWQLFSLRS